MGLSLASPSLSLGVKNRILGALGLPGSSDFAMRDLWGNGEQGVWYEPYDPNALHQRRNLLTFTDQMNLAPWTTNGVTVTANAYSDRWDKIVEDTSTGGHSIQSGNLTASAGFTYTAQVKLRAGERDKLRLLLANAVTWGGVNPSVSVDLVAVTATPANGAANATITALGSGEFLVTFTAVATTDNTSGLRIELRDAAGATTYTGDGVSGAFATDAQVERAQFANGYQRVTDWNTEYLSSIAFPNIAMYQDAAGTVPVTAVEQPVGLLLDKRLGLVRGVELVSNGDFSSGGATWTPSPGDGSISFDGSTATITRGATTNAFVSQNIGMVVGRTYEIVLNIVGGVSPVLRVWDFAATVKGTFTGVGAHRLVFQHTHANGHLLLAVSTAGSSAIIDNISVRELPGNHASQSTAAARPVLSARKNLLTKTEQINDAAWVKLASTTVGDTLTEDNTSAQHHISQAVSNIAFIGGRLTCSAQFRPGTGTRNVGIRIGGTSGSAYAVFNPATGALVTSATTGSNWTHAGTPAAAVATEDGWFRASITVIPNETGFASAFAQIVDGTTLTYLGNGTSSIRVRMEQFEHGPTATRYQRVNTATDYDTFGFPHYLKFDGVDDHLVTNAINFTATDKMTVWAGVTKLSDAAVGMIVELSATVDGANPGSFFIDHSVGGANYAAKSRGSIVPGAAVVASPFIAPHTAVITGDFDIATDKTVVRVNTTSFSGVADQGTGTYGTYPFYIGRRGGTSLPFNGQLNSLAVRGAASTTNQIINAERHVASKTGVQLP